MKGAQPEGAKKSDYRNARGILDEGIGKIRVEVAWRPEDFRAADGTDIHSTGLERRRWSPGPGLKSPNL